MHARGVGVTQRGRFLAVDFGHILPRLQYRYIFLSSTVVLFMVHLYGALLAMKTCVLHGERPLEKNSGKSINSGLQ